MSIKLRVTECVYCTSCNHPIGDPVWEGKYSELSEIPCPNCGKHAAAIDMALTVGRRFTEMGMAMQGATSTAGKGFTWSDSGDGSKVKGCPQEFQQLLKIIKSENKGSTIPERW